MRKLDAPTSGATRHRADTVKQVADKSAGQSVGFADIDSVGIALDIGDDLIEHIAERAAKLIAERQDETAGDGWLRGADKIAAYIDAPRSRVYGLVSARRIPVHHDGSALIARRSELIAPEQQLP